MAKSPSDFWALAFIMKNARITSFTSSAVMKKGLSFSSNPLETQELLASKKKMELFFDYSSKEMGYAYFDMIPNSIGSQ